MQNANAPVTGGIVRVNGGIYGIYFGGYRIVSGPDTPEN